MQTRLLCSQACNHESNYAPERIVSRRDLVIRTLFCEPEFAKCTIYPKIQEGVQLKGILPSELKVQELSKEHTKERGEGERERERARQKKSDRVAPDALTPFLSFLVRDIALESGR